LAKWLGTQPGVLLLDAPTVGVDVTARSAIYQVIREVAAQGAAVLLISDEIEEVWSNTHRVHVMKAGQLGPAHDPRAITLDGLADIVHG